MRSDERTDFLSGVIEGFYGQPWSQAERFELFDWMAAWGLNTYLYAPKDDLKHRAIWREPYSASEGEPLAQLIEACHRRGLRFIYALSPGLDIRYGGEGEIVRLCERFGQMLALGCRDVALLFDDIPGDLNAADLSRWGSLASAQSHVANAVFAWIRERQPRARIVFCPTPYCGRMADAGLGGPDYLATVGRELLPAVDIIWTGPEIISREITVAHVRELRPLLRRKPLIWDNLHANDYDSRRFFCGPYTGRAPALRDEVSGLLSNPNNELPLNYVPLRTLAAFVRGGNDWQPRAAYLEAMREWLPVLETIGPAIDIRDLILFADCFYLPHEDGPGGEALFARVERLVTRDPSEWGQDGALFSEEAARLKEVCTRLTELRHRPVFHAFSRRLWELREELDVLDRYVASNGTRDIRTPGGRRGGLVARLQRLRWSQTR